jgi:hypothetical protein
VSCDRAPSFVGAYVLGALDPAERLEADAHLARCPDCAAELESFRGLTVLLGRVPADEVTPEPVAPSPELFGRVAAEVRRPIRRRWAAGGAAAAVLVTAGGTWAAVRDTGEVHTAAADGVRLSVVADERADGTALDVTIAGLPVNSWCELVVVDDHGKSHDAGDWTTDGDVNKYWVWSQVDPENVSEVVLLGVDGEELVSVPFTD